MGLRSFFEQMQNASLFFPRCASETPKQICVFWACVSTAPNGTEKQRTFLPELVLGFQTFSIEQRGQTIPIDGLCSNMNRLMHWNGWFWFDASFFLVSAYGRLTLHFAFSLRTSRRSSKVALRWHVFRIEGSGAAAASTSISATYSTTGNWPPYVEIRSEEQGPTAGNPFKTTCASGGLHYWGPEIDGQFQA